MIDYLLGNKGAHLYNGNIYKCFTCGKTYNRKSFLQKHQCIICTFCDKLFTSSQKLKSHNCATISSCDYCNKDFKSKRTFSNHKCTYCKHCSTVFSSVQKLNQHLDYIKVVEDVTKPTIKLESKGKKKTELIKTNLCKSSVEIKPTESEIQKVENIEKNKEDILSDTSAQYVELHNVFKKESTVVDEVKDKRHDDVQGRNMTKNNCQNVSTKAASNDELIYLGTQQMQNFTFHPIDMKWQAVQTIKFKLPVLFVHHFYSSESLIQVPTNIHPIIGDGNCFFRAVSFIMTGSEDYHEAVRKHLTAYMMTIPLKLSTVLPPRITVRQYLQKSNMASLSVWATEVEITAMASCLQTDIYVFSFTEQTWKWLKY
ncbi:Hypothetical predicted protein [Mytilus galloprovincialis]|uniref:C2H2-type domain-containing protein n=1 Tax=Mytilus galloprovincialis TaxID=29158 RepID=A0A8B6HE28_MYTGA|nr:Hypothetical predicted protein [Mytilus galloprovincialis]